MAMNWFGRMYESIAEGSRIESIHGNVDGDRSEVEVEVELKQSLSSPILYARTIDCHGLDQ